jgi:hypothetical protein
MADGRERSWRRKLRGFEALESRLLLAAQPIITEFMASNGSTIEDGFGNDSDWVELYNAGDAPVDLQGYHLTDSLNNLTKWTFPTSTVLNPGAYLIVFASDANTIDPLGYHHTNYKLSAEGEDIALVAPNLTILSQIGPDGDDYPPQLTDISYGLSGNKLIDATTPSRYLIPTNGTLGLTWTEVNFDAAANGFAAGQSAVGYDTTASPVNYADYFKTTVPNGTNSVYIRTEFNLESAAAVSNLNLNLKYDDGVVVYLNGQKALTQLAPASPVWNSLATGTRNDSTVITGTDFPLNAYLEFLQTGKNVLAIHLLNANGSSDLLVDPELTAVTGTGTLGFLATPTPGSANSGLIDIGPIIDPVTFSPENPADNQTITVTARITEFLAPINTTSVQLVYRVMYGTEVVLAMSDSGLSGDAVAGDGIYTAQIPASASSAGQMVRWYVRAADTSGSTSRAPRFLDPLDSPEYYGTVIVNPAVTTELPVIHWFVQNTGAAATEAGTRASLYMLGQFYDNIRVDLHGQSTSDPVFTKKSFNFDANGGLKFEVDPSFGRVSDFNLLTNYADKTYLRNTMAYDLFTAAGGAGHYAFSAVVQRNGSYYGLYDVVEDGDEEFLERVGLDPDGALYKLNNAFDSSTVNVEKKTREYENNSDLQQLVSSASLNGLQAETWIYDNLDVAGWVNYFAIQSLIANRDYGQKNYYLYRDSNDTELWTLLPWDVDLSFGHQWNFSETYFDDDLVYTDGYFTNMGGNHLINRLSSLPKFNEMYRRRLRSLMDEFYGAPGSNIEDSYAANRFDELIAEIGADAVIDRAAWGYPNGLSAESPTQAIARVKVDFLAKRRDHLATLSAMPAAQTANPALSFGTIDFNPADGNQAQEYIAIINSSGVAVDISGWTISGAVDHEFGGGTVIPANSVYYVVADVAQFKQRTTGPTGGQRLFIQGNYEGQLNNVFGSLSLKDRSNTTIASTSYGSQPLAGDYDGSGTVDNLDYELWKTSFGSTVDLAADGNANGVVDAGDYTVWQDNFGASNNGAGGAAASLGLSELSTDSAEAGTTDQVSSLSVWAGSLESLVGEQPALQLLTANVRSLGGAMHTAALAQEQALLVVLAEREMRSATQSEDLSWQVADEVAATDDAFAELLGAQLPTL